jgi:hypothetical protein
VDANGSIGGDDKVGCVAFFVERECKRRGIGERGDAANFAVAHFAGNPKVDSGASLTAGRKDSIDGGWVGGSGGRERDEQQREGRSERECSKECVRGG